VGGADGDGVAAARVVDEATVVMREAVVRVSLS